MSHKFNVTAIRKPIVISMLEKQHSVSTLATSFGVSDKTMRKALKSAGIDPKSYRRCGMARLKQTMFERLEMIDKDKDYTELALKVLDRYETTDDSSTSIGSTTKTSKDISKQILDELNDG